MQKLEDKEDALTRAERNVVSRDKVINELRLRLPAAANRERLLAEVNMQEESDVQVALRMAQQTIRDLQERLEKKEDVLKKYHSQLTEARQVRVCLTLRMIRDQLLHEALWRKLHHVSLFAGTGKHDEDASVGAQEIAPQVGLLRRLVPGPLQTSSNGEH